MSLAYLARINTFARFATLAVFHVAIFAVQIAAAHTLACGLYRPARLAAFSLGVESVIVSLTASVDELLAGAGCLVVVPTLEGPSARTRDFR